MTTWTPLFETGSRKNRRELRKAANAAARAARLNVRVDDHKDDVLDRPLAGRWGRFEEPMWGPAAPRLPVHRVSARRFGIATPFLAEAGIGYRGAPVGRDLLGGGRFFVDPWEWYRARYITGPSMVSIGQVGTGKSVTNKTLANGLIALGRKVAVASDPKGEWTAVADMVGGKTVRIGPGRAERINPLDAGQRPQGLTESAWFQRSTSTRRGLLTSILTLLRHGQPLTEREHTALELALNSVLTSTRVPTLPDVMDALMNPEPAARAMVSDSGDPLGHALRRLVSGDLGGMFDQPSTVSFDAEKPMIVMNTTDLLTADAAVTAIAAACTNVWLDSVIRAGTNDFWLVITEEGWAAMRDPNMVARMDERVRLAGEWGIANMLIMHELADLDMVGEEGSSQRNQALGLLSKSQVKIIHQQSVTTVAGVAKALGLTPEERELVTQLGQGRALWKVGKRSFLVHTTPTAAELQIFNTDARRAG